MPDLVPLQPVDYVVIGHVTEDMTPAGPRMGGTATFSALTARALGLRAGVVTAAGPGTPLKVFGDIPVVVIPSERTTRFENSYTEQGRQQTLRHQAARIEFEDVPLVWGNASIIHLGPVAQELGTGLPKHISPSLLGITPQGWMRAWDGHGRVTPVKWESADRLLPKAGAVVISYEDVSSDDELIEAMAHHTRVLAVTDGAAGSVLYWNGDRRRFRPPEVKEVDPTGAGDIFAAAFFIRLSATRDPWEAARFATRLSAYSVTRIGLDGIPTRKEIDECLIEVLH